jgi:hypothetical protein
MSEEHIHTPTEEHALIAQMLRGLIALAAGEQQAAAMFDNPQRPIEVHQTVKRMIDYTKNFIRENAEYETSNN